MTIINVWTACIDVYAEDRLGPHYSGFRFILTIYRKMLMLTKRFTVRKKPPALFVLFYFFFCITIRFTCARVESLSLSPYSCVHACVSVCVLYTVLLVLLSLLLFLLLPNVVYKTCYPSLLFTMCSNNSFASSLKQQHSSSCNVCTRANYRMAKALLKHYVKQWIIINYGLLSN